MAQTRPSPTLSRGFTRLGRFLVPYGKKTSGYHGQARVENAFFRYKSIIGDSLRACSPAGRGTEVDLACNILNQMTGLGRSMSYRIGRRKNCGSGSVWASSDSCNNA